MPEFIDRAAKFFAEDCGGDGERLSYRDGPVTLTGFLKLQSFLTSCAAYRASEAVK
jgi:hypothetical protein